MVAAIERTRARGGLIIAQLNRQMPYTLGDAELDCDMIDLAIELDEPLPTVTATERGATADAIAPTLQRSSTTAPRCS